MYLPDLQVQDSGASLKVLLVDNTNLTRNKRVTALTEDVVIGGMTLAVQSIVAFESLSTSSGQVLLVGQIGSERTELRRTSVTSGESPSSSYKWVYLREALQFDHPQDTKVTIVDWDRIEFGYSATATGAKTTIAAYPTNIQPDATDTVFRDTTEPLNRVGQSTVFYFARYVSTIDSRNSDWSDPVYGTGYDDNTVYAIKKRAVDELGEEIDGNIITHEFLNECLWQARREYHQSPGKRPFRRKFNTVIGSALTGSYRIELPTDVEKPYGADNIYGVRIGPNANMEYYDKKSWDFDYRNIPHSTLDLPYTRDVSTSLWLANGRDFSQSGSISVEGTNIGYSKVTGSNNSLTITSHGGWDASGGSDVWQNVTYGLPSMFTVFQDPAGSAYVYFDRVIDTAYIGMNIYADYYRTLVGYNSNGDVLDEPTYDFYVNYLKAKIKQRKVKGEMDITKDSDYILYVNDKNKALANERLSTDIRVAPDISHLPIPD